MEVRLLPRLLSNTKTSWPCSFRRTVLASTSFTHTYTHTRKSQSWDIQTSVFMSFRWLLPCNKSLLYVTNLNNMTLAARWYCWCTAGVSPTGGSRVCYTWAGSGKTHPQNPVEVLFIHSQELTVVLSQDNGGGAGSVVDQSELPKVVSFMKSTNDTLRNTSPGLTKVWTPHWSTSNTHFSIDDNVDWAFQNNVPWCALFPLTEHWGRGAIKPIRHSTKQIQPVNAQRKVTWSGLLNYSHTVPAFVWDSKIRTPASSLFTWGSEGDTLTAQGDINIRVAHAPRTKEKYRSELQSKYECSVWQEV